MKQFQFLQITRSQSSVINVFLPLAHTPSFTLLVLLITYYILHILTEWKGGKKENPFQQIKDAEIVQIQRKGCKRDIKKIHNSGSAVVVEAAHC